MRTKGVVDRTAQIRVPLLLAFLRVRNRHTLTFLLLQVLQPFDLQGAPPIMSESISDEDARQAGIPKLPHGRCFQPSTVWIVSQSKCALHVETRGFGAQLISKRILPYFIVSHVLCLPQKWAFIASLIRLLSSRLPATS